jgi:hypothetical protein
MTRFAHLHDLLEMVKVQESGFEGHTLIMHSEGDVPDWEDQVRQAIRAVKENAKSRSDVEVQFGIWTNRYIL